MSVPRRLADRVARRSRLYAHLKALPAEALSLGALFAATTVALAIALAFPMSPEAPLGLIRVLAVVALVLGVGTLAFGGRVPRGVLLAEAILAVILNSVLVAVSATTGGAMVDAFAYVWLTVYVALFFPGAAFAFAVLVVVGFGAGLLVAGLPGTVTAWGVLTVAVLGVAVVLSRLSRAVRRLVEIDGLTGALNRSAFYAAVEREADRARRREEELAVVAIDLDGFKLVNDSQGHAAGDRLLAEVTEAWRGVLRAGDRLARTGGDEFVLLLPATSTDRAAEVVKRLRDAHAASWSAGIAGWLDGDTIETCLERADKALYAEKARRPAARAAAVVAPRAA